MFKQIFDQHCLSLHIHSDLPQGDLNVDKRVVCHHILIEYNTVSAELNSKLEANLNSSPADEIKYRKFIGIYYKFLWIFGLIVLLSTPFLWWGAIMSLAKLANEGKMSF